MKNPYESEIPVTKEGIEIFCLELKKAINKTKDYIATANRLLKTQEHLLAIAIEKKDEIDNDELRRSNPDH